MKGCHQGRLGLTLIELLLVIGIIAVLAGIIWCVFAPVRERARQAVCLGNLRQVWLATVSVCSWRRDTSKMFGSPDAPMTSPSS
jgi:prepilin-type N-terminal cleavage/methylation domain-containing protein